MRGMYTSTIFFSALLEKYKDDPKMKKKILIYIQNIINSM